MSTPALICDTGALLDYLSAAAPDHAAFREAIDDARTRYVPGLVLPEIDYFLRRQRKALHAFMADLARGAFTYAPPTASLLVRSVAVDRRYAAIGLGLVGASIVALAEELDVRRRPGGVRRGRGS